MVKNLDTPKVYFFLPEEAIEVNFRHGLMIFLLKIVLQNDPFL